MKILVFSILIALASSLSFCQASRGEKLALIPKPNTLILNEGMFPICLLKTVKVPVEWKAGGEAFLEDMNERTGISLLLATADDTADLLVEKQEGWKPESYLLQVQEHRIIVKTGDMAGMHHALVTFQQLALQADEGKIPSVTIIDSPRFEHRGLMLDCSRHFWTVNELKENINQLSFFKLNVLHLHLTDNQGWRLAMEKYPDLAEKGTYYKGFPALSGKYYTQEDLKALVDYAAVRGVEIIPEVDLPGHSSALLAGMPQLSCRGGEFMTYPQEMPYEQRTRTDETMVCVGNRQVYDFVADLIDELADIFPSPYIHLGGDEVSTGVWETCPRCRALYEKEGMTDYHQLQDYFTARVRKIAQAKGKTMLGWDEVNTRGAAMPGDRLTVWRNDGVEQQKKALEQGVAVIMTPRDPCYFDFGYARNPTRKVYEWEPVSTEVPVTKRGLVKGGQACLWTEFVVTQSEVEHMLYPRLCALGEVLWSETGKRDWNDFYGRLSTMDTLFAKLGINHYTGDYLDEPVFYPDTTAVKWLHPAKVETDMQAIKGYGCEYVFDGSNGTFFQTSYAPQKGNYVLLTLDTPLKADGVKVVCDDSKEFLTMADLLVSADGHEFQKVASFMPDGKAEGKVKIPAVKSVCIKVTGNHFSRLTIREIVLK